MISLSWGAGQEAPDGEEGGGAEDLRDLEDNDELRDLETDLMSDRVKYPEEHESCDDPRDELPDQAEQTPGNEIHDGLKVTDDGESFYSQHSLTWALR